MKFSAQEEYGLRLLLQIGRAEQGRTVTIPELAKLEELSEPHVAKLLMILRKSNFIRSTRGQTGGYQLALPADEIVIGHVLEHLGGKVYSDGFCVRHSGLATECTHMGDCALQGLWLSVQNAIDGVLLKQTLADLIKLSHRGGLVQLGTPPPNK